MTTTICEDIFVGTHFNIVRKMADAKFARATSWEEIITIHRKWMHDYHVQRHWAHEKREDGCHSPVQVLAWHRGTMYSAEFLDRVAGIMQLPLFDPQPTIWLWGLMKEGMQHAHVPISSSLRSPPLSSEGELRSSSMSPSDPAKQTISTLGPTAPPQLPRGPGCLQGC